MFPDRFQDIEKVLNNKSRIAYRIVLAASVLVATAILFALVFRADVGDIAEPPTEPAFPPEAAVPDAPGLNSGSDQALSPLDAQLDGARSMSPGTSWTISELTAINAASDELFEGNAERADYQRVNSRFEKLFVFPDGEAATINFDYSSELPDPIEHLDDGISGGFFDPLSEAARNGNARAARTLYDSLSDCQDFPNSNAQFNEEVRLIREGRMLLPPGRSPEEYISRLERGFRRCDGTDESMMEEATTLLRLAADSGHKPSTIAYAFSLVESNPDIAEEYFNRLWNGGVISGLIGLARIYEEKARVNVSYQMSVTAYAYAYAALALGLAEFDGYPEPPFARVRADSLNNLRDLEASASYAVAQSGANLARNIIVQHENCCTR